MGSTASTLRASSLIFLALSPRALATNGVDFSNNLFSDLGPVLSLFGEQVAKQFMSQSMSWLEDVIFAMAPLGIITAIISAVRVGGPTWLKAVVGRARESEAVAEMELMSSTSHEVCELWNGQAIVRVMGSPDISEILYFEDMVDGEGECGFFTLETAIEKGILERAEERKDGSAHDEESLLGTSINSPSANPDSATTDPGNPRRHRGEDPRNTSRLTDSNSAPNISLNFCKIKRQKELWISAILGIVLQFGSLVFIGVTHYHPHLNWRGDQNSGYAYPLMASGTLFLVMGMMACSHAVQASSVETTWVAKKMFRILWLQKSATVNDQLFGSYVLFSDNRNRLTTSRRRSSTPSSKSSSFAEYALAAVLGYGGLAIVGSLISIAGFITQFVGIRALHWSASIAQLTVTLAMTAVRTWIRRNMSERPGAKILPTNYEIDWLAVKSRTSLEELWTLGSPPHKPGSPEDNGDDDDRGLEVLTLQPVHGYKATQEAHTGPTTDTKRMLKMWEELGHLTGWKGLSYPFALELVKCLESLLSCFVTSQDVTLENNFTSSETFQWVLPVGVGDKIGQVTITAKRSRRQGNWSPWKVSISEICAIISLWSYRMEKYERALEAAPDGDRVLWGHGDRDPAVLRALGPATNRFFLDRRWWMDRGGRFAAVETSELQKSAKSSSRVITLNTKELSNTTASVAPHRIMGANPESANSLIFISETPLRRMCAQEILSSFMWAITGTIRSIVGKTEPRGTTLPKDDKSGLHRWSDFKLENAFSQKLAEIMTESRVTSNIQDAYVLIIPPFVTADRLDGMSYVIAETQHKLKNLQRVEKQENVRVVKKTYIELFDTCRQSSQTHSTTVTVTALLMEEIYSLNITLGLYADRASLQNNEEIRRILENIKHKLIKDGDRDTLRALICLYEKQNRDDSGIGQLLSNRLTETRAACGFGSLEELKDRAGWNPAHKLATDDQEPVYENFEFRLGLTSGGSFDLNAVDILGWTPLHYAANKPGDHLSLVRGILDASGQVDPRTKSDYTPLHYAAANGHTRVVSGLYERGAAKDSRNIDMRTPLHLAAEQGHIATTKFLLSKGADAEARDKYDWTPLHYAAARGRKDVTEELLADGARAGARENLGMTPLHMAASTGQLGTVEIIFGQDPKAATPLDHISRTPLHLAALNGHSEVVGVLIENTSLDAKDHEKNTPLHSSARRGNRDAVNRLLHSGANPNSLNSINSTPLHLACQNGHIEVVDELLSAGADPTFKAPASRGQTPLERLKANRRLPEDRRNKLIARLEEYTESWLANAESPASQISL